MRPEGWEARLAAAIEAGKGLTWEWGRHDCASFALSCLSAVLNGAPGPFDDLRGTWNGPREALDIVNAGGGLLAIVSRGLPEIDPRQAQRGDWAAFPGGQGLAGVTLGVVDGVGAWCAADPRGLMRAPMAVALRAWAIR